GRCNTHQYKQFLTDRAFGEQHRLSFPTRRASDLGFGLLQFLIVLALTTFLRTFGQPRLRLLRTQVGVLATMLLVAVVARGLLVRSEEHTSELQSREYLVCRLMLGKINDRFSKNKK